VETQTQPQSEARRAPARDWNFSAIVVGLPGSGKTTLQRSLIRRHLTTTNGIVLAHDPMAQFKRDGCVFYRDVADYRAKAAAAAAANTTLPRGACIGGFNSDDVMRLAVDLGEKLNTAERVNVPILVPCDEGSLREGSGSTHVSELDNRILSTRRHLGLGLILNVQEAAQLMNRWYRMSTDVFLFKQTSDRARKLDEWLQLERGSLESWGVTELADHHYLHVRPGKGLVTDSPL
jgi:ABC-type oligopeptide transport system ATPase subunit